MTRADDLEAIKGHLESALFIVHGLPVSAHQRCLAGDIKRALRDKGGWVALYLAGEARDEKTRAGK